MLTFQTDVKPWKAETVLCPATWDPDSRRQRRLLRWKDLQRELGKCNEPWGWNEGKEFWKTSSKFGPISIWVLPIFEQTEKVSETIPPKNRLREGRSKIFYNIDDRWPSKQESRSTWGWNYIGLSFQQTNWKKWRIGNSLREWFSKVLSISFTFKMKVFKICWMPIIVQMLYCI